MTHQLMAGAAIALAAGAASAAMISDATVAEGPMGVAPLSLEPFGGFVKGTNPSNGNYGVNWDGSGIWMAESWAGAPGEIADVAVNLTPGVIPVSGDAVFPIVVDKQVTNESDIFWNAYEIEIVETGSGTISNVTASPNAEFAGVTISPITDGVLIRYDLSSMMGGTGSGVSTGNSTLFNFSFDYTGDITDGIDFRIIQTAIPTPGTLGLVGIAGLAVARRNRR